MLNSHQNTAITLNLNVFGTLIGVRYQSTAEPLIEENFETSLDYPRVRGAYSRKPQFQTHGLEL